ncbi:head GIN domain-containing protein [Neptunitalea lumnitzerae]|uniref:DUF2807 domain-containing protein n=1 Tax=Neptunitalea lumnitzerae TaxID=2965509 RepID=A0ABQ5MKX2_9FLAO|nr:head GIN domain-containing protein [Neptunitalea sp. Y10]GLB50063.1 DUF2807 domain-containing protein [Neptunitalea sp. Y10]
MKSITKLSILTFAILFITSCNASWNGIEGNGRSTTSTRNVGSFDGIEVAGSYHVTLEKGNEGKVTINAEENIIDYIVTEVTNNVLHIYTKDGFSLRSTRGIKITVGFSNLNKAILTGSGSIKSESVISASKMTASVTGSGDIALKVKADKVDSYVTGSGDILLEGDTTDFKCTVTGSGDISAYELKASNVIADVTGSGDIHLYCKANLKAYVSGSGDIYYKGNPEIRDLSTSGSGDINKDN